MLAILSGCTGLAGLEEAPESEKTFERIVDAPGFSKDKIFESTKIWVAQNFRSAKAVMEYENKEAGRIIGNGVIDYPCSGMECLGKSNWKVLFTMQVDIKEQKFKLTFTNLVLSVPPTYNGTFGVQSGFERPVWQKGDFNSIRPVLLKFGDRLAASIQNTKARENW
jgi:hypothetical protein